MKKTRLYLYRVIFTASRYTLLFQKKQKNKKKKRAFTHVKGKNPLF